MYFVVALPLRTLRTPACCWAALASYQSLPLARLFFFFSSRRRHTRFDCDWSSDVCSSDLHVGGRPGGVGRADAARFVVVRFPRSRRLVADLLAARPAAGTAGPGVAPTWRAPTCCGRRALRPRRRHSRLETRIEHLRDSRDRTRRRVGEE